MEVDWNRWNGEHANERWIRWKRNRDWTAKRHMKKTIWLEVLHLFRCFTHTHTHWDKTWQIVQKLVAVDRHWSTWIIHAKQREELFTASCELLGFTDGPCAREAWNIRTSQCLDGIITAKAVAASTLLMSKTALYETRSGRSRAEFYVCQSWHCHILPSQSFMPLLALYHPLMELAKLMDIA